MKNNERTDDKSSKNFLNNVMLMSLNISILTSISEASLIFTKMAFRV